jgi:hypothetical protein
MLLKGIEMGGGGGYTGIGLSVCRRNGFRALDSYPYHLESPYHTYKDYPWEEDDPY